MTKRDKLTNNDLQIITQQTKNCATQTYGDKRRLCERVSKYVPISDPVVITLLSIQQIYFWKLTHVSNKLYKYVWVHCTCISNTTCNKPSSIITRKCWKTSQWMSTKQTNIVYFDTNSNQRKRGKQYVFKLEILYYSITKTFDNYSGIRISW